MVPAPTAQNLDQSILRDGFAKGRTFALATTIDGVRFVTRTFPTEEEASKGAEEKGGRTYTVGGGGPVVYARAMFKLAEGANGVITATPLKE
jgi:hypothetical protein